jgi:maleate cis-trans isomerase
MSARYRIGQIVPSSNVTMETEIPALFRARELVYDDRFTFPLKPDAHETGHQRRVGRDGS